MRRTAKILVVDDEKINIDVLIGLLTPLYRVVAAKDGEQALKRLQIPPLPDLILLDVLMPGMDGYEVCRRIKEDSATRDIPVMFITSKTEEKDEAMGFKVGAVDYITKPFSPLICLARVNTHIELKRRGDMLEQLAGLDGLTGIPNRRRFDEMIQAEWQRALRHGHPLSLLMMDIDFFKQFNDQYGHAGGDDCLRRVAGAIIRAVPRSGDMAARYGGEEFVSILPETNIDGACLVGERVRNEVGAMKISHKGSDAGEYVSISIGVATLIPKEEGRARDLIEQADAALYMAKEKGRDRVVAASMDRFDSSGK